MLDELVSIDGWSLVLTLGEQLFEHGVIITAGSIARDTPRRGHVLEVPTGGSQG